MTLHLGDVPAGSTLYIPFAAFDSDGASVALSGLAVTDIEIYKNGSTTQRASDAGYALLDTDGIDFDGITGINGFSIDLADNTDAGFYSAGGFYWVVVSSVTIDGQTVNFIAATFRIVPAEASAGVPKVDVSHAAGVAWASGAIVAAAIASDAFTAAKFASDVGTEFADALLTRQMTESYAANGVAPTTAQALFAIHQMLMQFGISGTNLTVKRLDNTTNAFIVTLNSATTPTGAART